MRNFLILLIFLPFNQLISQEIIEIKDGYIDNNLVYKVANDSLFSGIAQSKRKNGHLIYEEVIKNGIILSSNLYFNGKEKIISDRTIYNKYKLLAISKEYSYNLKGEVIEIVDYDENGTKNLVERFENGELSYRCEYKGKNKHGIEFCYSDDGDKLTFEYANGKKIKKQ